MISLNRRLRVALIQVAPEYLNLSRSIEKAVAFSEQAAKDGAQLVCFGETWLPGYPAWLDYCPDAALWNHSPVKDVFAALRANSANVGGPETALLSETAARLKIAIVIGINERVETGPGHGTLYNSILFFAPDGRLVNHHRKLVPTYTERLVWGPGDGAGLRTSSMHGVNLGALVCWEHWMPLSRQALHNCGEQVHVALWPSVHEMHQVASRHYAFEGRCFVLAVGLTMSADALPQQLRKPESLSNDALVLRGGSAVIAPDGRYLVGPVFDKETVLTAEIDLTEIDREVMTLDVTGHYSRPDVFDFAVKPGLR